MTILHDELLELIAEEALVDKARLTPEATLGDTGLDSVGVVSVAFAVEEKYGVEIPDEAFSEITTFGQFMGILEAAIQEKAKSPA
jgi:acyl carrier protein